MVLKIFNGTEIIPFTDIDNTFFRTRSYGGMMYLQFDISPDHRLYPYIASEETEIEYDGQRYLIKGINERKTITTINAELNLTGLTSVIFTEFIVETESFYNVCNQILKDTGWSIKDAELVSKQTSLDLKDVTPLDILEHCTNLTAYNTCYCFDTINRIIYCIKPENNTEPTGTYFTDELNLAELTFKGSSGSLITRLYPYGKDGVDISSVNNGKEYIENYTYTDRIISQVWRDERYTNPQSLYDDAVVKLATLAVPQRAYTAKIIDLAKALPEIYGEILKYDLYDIATIVDRKRKAHINYRIVEVKEYPANADLNTVTFSTVPAKISGKINNLDKKVNTLNSEQLHDRTKINEIKQDLDTTVLRVSESWASSVNESMFTQTSLGLYLQVDKLVGTDRWSTLLKQSATDIQIAWNNISDYIKIENSAFNIYDDTDSLLMSLNKWGQEFWRDNVCVGSIGTSSYAKDNSLKSIAFHLDDGAYMTWAIKESDEDDFYTMVLTYCKKTIGDLEGNKLHCLCNLDLGNFNLSNAVLKDCVFEGGCISDTFKGYYITAVHSDGSFDYKSFELVFKNGILQSSSW